MPLKSGVRLGPYEIESPVGAGGMGEVYRARDTRLQRSVAIKVLPQDFAADPHFRSRLQREATSISALNHPSICALYDIGSENGVDYLVMEYCEGVTLAERVASGPLGPELAIDYAMQIADALERAHRQGITHRDLKPSNIMVTKSGVKLLDFGLAKRTLATTSPDSTAVRPLTEEHSIPGTIQYMAPEVLTGKDADHRSDIFALGLVMYEMLTGRRAFDGSSRAAVIAAILEREPAPITDLPVDGPLDEVIGACLAKDPDERIQSAHDLKLQLQWLANRKSRDAPAERRRWHPAALVFGVAAIASAAFFAGRRLPSARPVSGAMRGGPVSSTVLLSNAEPLAIRHSGPGSGFITQLIAMSPDGERIVYVGASEKTTQLYKRTLATATVEAIAGTQGALMAFFSPDGKWIGFLTLDKVMKVALNGGAPVAVSAASSPRHAVWTDDGFIIVANELGSTTFRVPEEGGDLQHIDVVGFNDALPDGRTLLYAGGVDVRTTGDLDSIMAFDRETKKRSLILSRGYAPRYVDGRLIFARAGDLHIVRFDPEQLKTIGPPELLQTSVAMASYARSAQFAIAKDGTIAYVPGGDLSVGNLAWIHRDGSTHFLGGPPQLYRSFAASPDGKRVAAEANDVRDSVWIFEGGERRRVPIADNLKSPIWTADGRALVAMIAPFTGPNKVVRIDADNRARELHVADTFKDLRWMTPDGNSVAIVRADRTLALLNLTDHSETATPLGQPVSDISPDGRWVAYVSARGGKRDVWVSPVGNWDVAQQISTDGGYEPTWCRKCPELFFRNGKVWYSVSVSTANGLEFGSSRIVWESDFIDTPGKSYDVSADGQRLLISKRAGPDTIDRIELLQNPPALSN